MEKKNIDNERMPVERWKEAVKAASNDANYRQEKGYTMTKDDFFVDGVQWADEHPRSGLVDLDELWHDISDDTDHSKPIIFLDDKGWIRKPTTTRYCDIPGFVSYMKEVNETNYIKWCYLEDILPSYFKAKI